MIYDFLTYRKIGYPHIVFLKAFSEKAIEEMTGIIKDLDPHRCLDYSNLTLSMPPDIRDYLINHLINLGFSIKPWHKHQREWLTAS